MCNAFEYCIYIYMVLYKINIITSHVDIYGIMRLHCKTGITASHTLPHYIRSITWVVPVCLEELREAQS